MTVNARVSSLDLDPVHGIGLERYDVVRPRHAVVQGPVGLAEVRHRLVTLVLHGMIPAAAKQSRSCGRDAGLPALLRPPAG